MSYFISRPEARLKLIEIANILRNGIEKEMSLEALNSLVGSTLEELTELYKRLGTKIYCKPTTNFIRFYLRRFYYNKRKGRSNDENITLYFMKIEDFEQRKLEILDLCNMGKSGELLDLINEINESNNNPKIALRNRGDRSFEIRYSEDYFIEGLENSKFVGSLSFKDYGKNRKIVDDYIEASDLKAILKLPFVISRV